MKLFKEFFLLLPFYCGVLSVLNASPAVSADAQKWHVYRHSPSVELRNEEDVLLIIYRKRDDSGFPEARLSFNPPINVKEFPILGFRIRLSEPTKFGAVAIREAGWKNRRQPWLAAMCGFGSGEMPAGQWLEATYDLRDKGLDLENIIQLGFGYPVQEIPEGKEIVVALKDFAFSAPPKSNQTALELAAAWDKYIAGFQPDLSPLPPVSPAPDAAPRIVADGAPRAEIVAKQNDDPVIATAVEELQHWLREITGATLPVVAAPSGTKPLRIYLGKEFASRYDADLKLLQDSDGYAVRRDGDNLYLFGDCSKGTMNAVFAFLENNSDLIFPRPLEALSAVFSKRADFPVVWADGLSRPKSRLRGWGTNAGVNPPDERWMARNFCNMPMGGGGWNPGVNIRTKWGGYIYYGGGHNLYYFLTSDIEGDHRKRMEESFGKNPEYYAFFNNERQFPKQMENNPCFTNPGMIKTFTTNVIESLRTAKPLPDSLGINVEDNWGVCQCPECLAPIRLPDGKEVKLGDENFRSTQFFTFLNQVADAVHREFPDVAIHTYAYFFTAMPPAIGLHPIIRPFFCPYVRPNDKKPLFSPVNHFWFERMDNWSRVASRTVIREYYGCGMRFPRPLAEVAAWDMREYVKRGVVEFTSEINPDRSRNISNRWQDYETCWDASMMDFWVITRLYWDPDRDVEELRRFYAGRAFRAAAIPMLEYYGILRQAWFASSRPSTLGDLPLNCAVEYIIKPGNEEKMRSLLAEAEELADHPVSRELIKRHRARFEEWVAAAKALTTPQLSVPLSDRVANASFDAPVWQTAAVINGFMRHGEPDKKSSHLTEVRLLHDAHNLYCHIKCHDPEPARLYGIEVEPDAPRAWPRGDGIELFFSDQGDSSRYYQFAFNYRGARCELDNQSRMNWSGPWRLETRVTDDGYEAIVVIPFETINFNLGRGADLRSLFFRTFSHNDPKITERSSWGGGRVHQSAEFGTLTLMR